MYTHLKHGETRSSINSKYIPKAPGDSYGFDSGRFLRYSCRRVKKAVIGD